MLRWQILNSMKPSPFIRLGKFMISKIILNIIQLCFVLRSLWLFVFRNNEFFTTEHYISREVINFEKIWKRLLANSMRLNIKLSEWHLTTLVYNFIKIISVFVHSPFKYNITRTYLLKVADLLLYGVFMKYFKMRYYF